MTMISINTMQKINKLNKYLSIFLKNKNNNNNKSKSNLKFLKNFLFKLNIK